MYVRYQSFDSRQALEDGVRKSRPFKIDIGAIFSVRPSMRSRVQQASFKAQRKELVFDIDMTDYDDIRTCCQEANICEKCWKFMTIAIKILDRALRGIILLQSGLKSSLSHVITLGWLGIYICISVCKLV